LFVGNVKRMLSFRKSHGIDNIDDDILTSVKKGGLYEKDVNTESIMRINVRTVEKAAKFVTFG